MPQPADTARGPEPTQPDLPGYWFEPSANLTALPTSCRAIRTADSTPCLVTVVPAVEPFDRTALVFAELEEARERNRIVRIVRVAGHLVLEAEVAESDTLTSALTAGLGVAQVAQIALTVLTAIETLHDAGLAHGHLAANLVLLDEARHARLAGAAVHPADDTTIARDLDAYRQLCVRAFIGDTATGCGPKERLALLTRIDERLGALAGMPDAPVWRATLAAVCDAAAETRVRDAPIDVRELTAARSRIGQGAQYDADGADTPRPARVRWWRVGLLVILMPLLAASVLIAVRDAPWLPEPLRSLGARGELPDASAARVRQLMERAEQAADPLEAIGYYRQVLVFRTDHAAARARMDDLIQRLRGELHALISTLDIETAENLLETWSRSIGPDFDAEPLARDLARARMVREHLRQAEAGFESGRLIAPTARNVRFHLEAVLDLIPGEPNATQGLSRLASALVERAEARLAAADDQGAAADLHAAFVVFPRHPALAPAQERLGDWRAAVQSDLVRIARADSIAALTTTDAAATVEAIEALGPLPANRPAAVREAHAGALSALRGRSQQRFESAMAAGDPDTARAWLAAIDAAADIGAPAADQGEHSRLAALQENVDAAVRRVELGQVAWKAGALSRPVDDCALSHWLAALRLDPRQQAARAGLEQIGSRATALALRASELSLPDETGYYERLAATIAAALTDSEE